MNDQVSMTVLVIDDDAHIRSSIGKFLIARGHTVIEAADGEKGVEVVESQAVDIVITDVKMPKMDGLEVLRRVQSVSPETEVIVIQVPPLRERPGDILFLARHFLADYARDMRKPPMEFSKEAEDWLQQQEFPGNVRMLKNAVERAAILCDDGEIDVEDLGFELVERAPIVDSGVDQVVQSLPEAQMDLPALERALLQEALRRTEGNQVRAADLLGISRMVLRYRMKKCGLL